MRLALTLILVMGLWAASAATYYVSTNGSDTTGDGSQGNPWRLPRKAGNTVAAGSTVIIGDGLYEHANLWQEIASGSSPSSPTVFIAAAGARPIIMQTNPSAMFHVIQLAGKSNIWLSGLEIIGTGVASTGIKLTGGGQGVIITNCIVRDVTGGHGILITPLASDDEATDHLVINCQIFRNGALPDGGDSPLHQIYIQTSRNRVIGCLIGGTTNSLGGGYGIHGYGSGLWGNEFSGNWITNCPDTGIGLVGSSTTNTTVDNNIIIGCGYGIRANYTRSSRFRNNTMVTNATNFRMENSTNCIVANNIAWSGGPAGNGGFYFASVDSIGFDKNISGSNSYSDFRYSSVNNLTNTSLYNISDNGTVKATNGVVYDPRFLNAAARNYRLSPGSPAIGAGLTLAEIGDIEGRARGSSWSIGAYQYAGPQGAGFIRMRLQ